jgi:hypothetical protein
MDASLLALRASGDISPEAALHYASNPDMMNKRLTAYKN